MRRVTLNDVAAHAGVSRSAASLAVRGTGRLSDDTRRRVKDAMAELGYVYHRGAATLRTQKSSIVGLIVTDVSNPFFAAMSLGFEQHLNAVGYLTVLTNTFDDPARFHALVRTMQEHPVDALVYVPVSGADLAFAMAPEGLPALAVTREPSVDAPFLGPDDHVGGALAAAHLIEVHGRRRFVYLGGPATAGPRSRRLDGVLSVINQTPGADLVLQIPGVTSIESGVALTHELLRSGVEFDAVICHSDVIAFAACHVFREHSIRVPSDVGMVGFDGLAEGAVSEPTISSVSAGPAHVGQRAATWVLDALSGGEHAHRELIRPVLEIRSSCGC